jgi:capsular exopolysaccharide synthesis family protein
VASATPLAPSAGQSDELADAALWDFPEEAVAVAAAPAQPVTAAAAVCGAAPAAAIDSRPAAVVAAAAAGVSAEGLPARQAAAPLTAANAGAVEPRDLVLQLPQLRKQSARRDIDETLVTGTTRRDAVEQYRKMAATMHHVQANRNIRVVLCTSAVMAEGKTVTAANLALTLSLSYQRRVLLIDADLRRPRLHSVFNLPNEEGLFEALRAPADCRVATTAVSPWLSVVTAGRPGADPVGVLTSERLSRVVEDAGASFDWVIIDTPPVLVLPDAGLLMNVVDAAVLVIGAGRTTYRMAKRAAEALGRDRIVGVVMNRADDAVLQEGYGQYYGYYQTSEQAG